MFNSSIRFITLFLLYFLFSVSTVNAYFDDFTSDPRQGTNWNVQNVAGLTFNNPGITLSSSNSRSYPYLKTNLSNDLSQDKYFEITFQYLSESPWGVGGSFTDNAPDFPKYLGEISDYTDTSIALFFGNKLLITSSICPLTSLICLPNLWYVFPNNPPTTYYLQSTPSDLQKHTLSMIRTDVAVDLYRYTIYLDNKYIFETNNTQRLVRSIWLGHPSELANSSNWPDLKIYSIRTLAFPPSTFPFLSQIDSRWGNVEYDTASQWASPLEIGINRWGCALTSAAMTLKNYGIKMPDGNEVNPDRLNTWLKANNGYIGAGLVNWIAITKLAKDSFFANQSTTKLEFVRTYTADGVTLPAIFGLLGHFVVAHGEESTNWKVNDPAKNIGNTDLPMTTTVKSVNRFIPSTTDLSYMLFTKPSGVEVTLLGSNKLPLATTWITEYLTYDPLDTAGPSIDTAMIAKPTSGKYYLQISNSTQTPSEVTVYLYDIEGELNKTNLLVEPGNSQYEVLYDKQVATNIRVTMLDTIPPTFVSTNTFTGWQNSPQLATFTYTDANLRSDYVSPTCQINNEGVNQTCTINPTVCDQAGNCNTTAQTSNPANIDLTAPTSQFALPTSANNWNGKITGTATDNLSGIAKVDLKIIYPNNTISNVIASGTNNWEYTITNIVPGKYRISSVAYDKASNIQTSSTSHEISVIKPPESEIKPPTILWTDGLHDRILIWWKPVKNATKYRIYYGTKKNELKVLGETKNIFFLSYELKPDKYYIGVTAISSTGKESSMSEIFKIEIKKHWSLHFSLPRSDGKRTN